MLLAVVYSCVGGGVGLYFLYRWIIPNLLQYHTGALLFWHDDIVPWVRDTLFGSTRPEVGLLLAVSLTHSATHSLTHPLSLSCLFSFLPLLCVTIT